MPPHPAPPHRLPTPTCSLLFPRCHQSRVLVQQHIDLSRPGELGGAAKAAQAGVEAGRQLADTLIDGASLLGSSEGLRGSLQGR